MASGFWCALWLDGTDDRLEYIVPPQPSSTAAAMVDAPWFFNISFEPRSQDPFLRERLLTAPDGMTIDEAGNVYLTRGRAVSVYDKAGKKVATIDVPEGTTNVCFGGKDGKTLFITAGTSLYSITMKVKGAARQ